MARLGKADQSLFESVIYPALGGAREEVLVGPQHGIDFGVVEFDDSVMVVSTDPISILPDLGFREAGRFALEFVLADVAVSGIAPEFLTVSFTLPSEMSDEEFALMWEGFTARAEELVVGVVAGHTARYSGVSFPWIGAGTAFGIGDPTDLIRPDGARPGDVIIVSGVPAGEVAGLFATLFPGDLAVSDEVRKRAVARIEEVATVEDAVCATRIDGVSAVHDVTEGGLIAGLVEMAESSGTRFDFETPPVVIPRDVRAVCAAIGVDLWQVTSAGTLLITVAESAAPAVVDALEDRGTPAVVAGTVTAGDGVRVDGESVSYPAEDPSWAAYRRFTDPA